MLVVAVVISEAVVVEKCAVENSSINSRNSRAGCSDSWAVVVVELGVVFCLSGFKRLLTQWITIGPLK